MTEDINATEGSESPIRMWYILKLPNSKALTTRVSDSYVDGTVSEDA